MSLQKYFTTGNNYLQPLQSDEVMSFSPWLRDHRGCFHQDYRQQLLHISGQWLKYHFSWIYGHAGAWGNPNWKHLRSDHHKTVQNMEIQGDWRGRQFQTVFGFWNHPENVEIVDLCRQLSRTFGVSKVVENTRPGSGTRNCTSRVCGGFCVWGEEAERTQLHARAKHVNSAVNTRRPLITRVEGQQEKNRSIPELLNKFRSG